MSTAKSPKKVRLSLRDLLLDYLINPPSPSPNHLPCQKKNMDTQSRRCPTISATSRPQLEVSHELSRTAHFLVILNVFDTHLVDLSRNSTPNLRFACLLDVSFASNPHLRLVYPFLSPIDTPLEIATSVPATGYAPNRCTTTTVSFK